MEGVYDRWVDPAFKRATFAIWLDISPRIITYRLLRRCLIKKKGAPKESWKDMFTLIRYAWNYQKKNHPAGFGAHKRLIEKYKMPYIYITSERERKAFLKHREKN